MRATPIIPEGNHGIKAGRGPGLAFQRPVACKVLKDFQGPKIHTFTVVQGRVFDVDHCAPRVNPEGRPGLAAAPEILQAFVDDVGTGKKGMTLVSRETTGEPDENLLAPQSGWWYNDGGAR
jgi:hypothetical protein